MCRYFHADVIRKADEIAQDMHACIHACVHAVLTLTFPCVYR